MMLPLDQLYMHGATACVSNTVYSQLEASTNYTQEDIN